MTQTENIKLTLIKMLDLIKSSDAKDWERIIEPFSYKIIDTPNETKREILSLYKGMGSLNDLTLHKDGYPLRKENEKFSFLKKQLFDLCLKDL